MAINKQPSIMLAAGGTGGHLFPAIAVADEFRIRNYASIHLVTDYRCKKYLPEDLDAKIHIINLHFKSGFTNKIRSLFQLGIGCVKALFLVKKIKPDVVIGFGGYPSFPTMLAAKILRIPIVIYEPNSLLGRVNHFFAKSTRVIALSYAKTIKTEMYDSSKILVIGSIVRSSIGDLSNKYNANANPFNIFIFGGSQGAKIFDTLIPNIIEELLKLNSTVKIKITQQVAKAQEAKLRDRYKALDVECELFDFCHNMAEIYKNTQIVITRSGAGAVAELTNSAIPAIFIPFPFAKDDHQFFNAKAIEEINASWCYKQEEIRPQVVAKKLNTLIKNRDLLITASQNLAKHQSKNAAMYLVDTVMKIIS